METLKCRVNLKKPTLKHGLSIHQDDQKRYSGLRNAILSVARWWTQKLSDLSVLFGSNIFKYGVSGHHEQKRTRWRLWSGQEERISCSQWSGRWSMADDFWPKLQQNPPHGVSRWHHLIRGLMKMYIYMYIFIYIYIYHSLSLSLPLSIYLSF